MPAPAHLRATFSGIFGSVGAASEEWSMGVALERTGDADVAGLTTLAAGLSQDWLNHLAQRVHNGVRLTGVKVADVGSNGKTLRAAFGAYSQGEWVGDIAGSGGAPAMPPQVALVIGLRTIGDGPSYRGRFYLPGPMTGSLAADQRISTLAQGTMSTAAKGFVQAINTRTAPLTWAGQVAIASAGGPSSGVGPMVNVVNAVVIGRALDTVRSRRARLLEEYVTTPL